ncbi:MAG: class II aldolase/adducin family protein [Desulfatiglandales bacterium]
MRLLKERTDIVRYGQRMVACGLTVATGGNLSVADRREGLVAISPSSMEYHSVKPSHVAIVTMEGEKVEGRGKPSSELPLHLALYRKRSDVQAVVHTHSIFATTIASLGLEIPAFHYLVAYSGKKIPLAPYATFGSVNLARNVARAIGNHNAVLMAHHGMAAVGTTLSAAFTLAEIVEYLARIYWQARSLGEPVILSEEEMEKVIRKMETYRCSDSAP